MSLVSGSNSDFSSSIFFFSSSSSMSGPSFVVDFSFLPSNSFSCCTEYSSMGSTMYKTSRPFFRKLSRNGDEDLLHELCQGLELRLQLLDLFLFIFVVDVETLLGRRLQLLAVELLQLLHRVLVDGVHHVQDLEALLSQALEEWGRGHRSDALTGDVVDVVLTFLHPVNVLLQADHLITGLRRAH